jgi:LacI family transcriptional regulator
VVARHDKFELYDSVVGDDAAGAALVMRHLFALGHSHIAHFANRGSADVDPATPHGDLVRRWTYEQMMAAAGLSAHTRVIESSFDEQTAYRSTLQLLASDAERPTAVFAGADEAAFGVMRALAELPAEEGGSIAVAGYDNTRFADHPSMSLTSVDQFGHELGRRAAALVLDRLGRERPSVHEVLEPRLIVRRTSVRGPAHSGGLA